nr:NAD(P)-dependent oxidoreductase [uncultured Limnohabitans sp.]
MMNQRIVLTGATGFLGSHLATALVAQGCEVIGLKRRSSALQRLAAVLPRLTLVDVEDADFDAIFRDHGKVDAIIHTATSYGRHNESVAEIFAANTEFPLRLLDAGSRAGVHAFMNTDTILDKYLNLYAFSKNQLLEWGSFFALHKKITFWNLRLEHFYGAGDDATKFTAHIVDSCLSNEPEIRLTLGEQRRDFIYIDDVVSAYLLLLREIQGAPPALREFDVGSGTSISIREFVTLVKRLTNSSTTLNFGALPYRDGEVMHSVANVAPLLALGWRCDYDIEAGIRKLLGVEALNV